VPPALAAQSCAPERYDREMKLAIVLGALALVRIAHADCADPAKVRAAVAKADKDNAARFAAALAKTKLKPIGLLPAGGGKGEVVPATTPSPRARGGTVALPSGDRMIVLPYAEMSCGGPEPAEFVPDGKQVFMIQRAPKGGKSLSYEVCDCKGSPAGCGARPVVTATGYVLPKNMSYGGVKQIEYAADAVNVRYGTKEQMPCPQAP